MKIELEVVEKGILKLRVEPYYNKDRNLLMCSVSKIVVDGCVTSCSPREDGNFNFVIEQMPRKKQSRIDAIERSLEKNKNAIKEMYLDNYLSIIDFIKVGA